MLRNIEIKMKFLVCHWHPNEISCVPLKSKWNLIRTTELVMKYAAYYWNPYKSIWLALRTFEILMKCAAYDWHSDENLLRSIELQMIFSAEHWKPNEMCCVPLKSKWNMLRTIDSVLSFNSNEMCCVPLKSKWNDYYVLRTTEILMTCVS